MTEPKNITEAKESIKYHIKFFESLLDNIRRGKEPHMGHAMWATWCLHRYIEDRLIEDIEKAIKENSPENNSA